LLKFYDRETQKMQVNANATFVGILESRHMTEEPMEEQEAA
jgi:hypothetical protein